MWKWGLNSTAGTTNVTNATNVTNVTNVMNSKNADLAVKTDGLHTLTPPGKLEMVP